MSQHYMDPTGTYRPKMNKKRSNPRDIHRAERWLMGLLKDGASIPEAWWDVSATFHVAIENLRTRIFQGKLKLGGRK